MTIVDLNFFGVEIGFSLFTILLAIAVPLLVYLCIRRPSGLPPFPATPIPILGNLLSLEKDPRAQFGRWSKKHGDIFSLYLGPKLAVVLNGFDTINEALGMEVFSDRPNLALFTILFRGRGTVASSGSTWKSQRQFSSTALKEFGFGRKNFEAGITEEVKHVLDFFASKAGEKHDFAETYNMSSFNAISLMLFGHRFKFDDANFIASCNALDTAVTLFAHLKILNFFPLLSKIPGTPLSVDNLLKNVRLFEEGLVQPELQRHYDEYDGTIPDFAAACIKEIKDRESAGLDGSELKANFSQTITDFYIAGAGTIKTAFKWLFLFLIRNPEVQEKCFQEIKDNVGVDHLPTLNDRPVLPYLQATIAETLRRSNIVPFSVAHATAEDTNFKGHTIPKGTMVMINVDSVSMDPKEWPEPEEFRPERFLDKSGAFFKPDAFIPFSTGRRVCMGEAFVKMDLFLISAALIQNFRFLQPEDEPTPSLEPLIGAAAVPQPYTMTAVKRSSKIAE